ncbi:tetratricopeptide repeat protein [Daejeonella sp.]|uniref:tetratricopeptide repeat-containing sensor histidine kinase n=1 Tax=Daejeonella sp. TaxID=2805397 RepID=UPI003983181C
MKHLLFFITILFTFFSCSEKKNDETFKESTALFQQASAFRDSAKKDSAYVYFNLAKDKYLQEKDSLAAGICLVNMGIISTDLGDHYGGQELSLDAVTYFDENNPAHDPYLLSNYNNLGIASYNLLQYAKAVEFYQKSLKFISDSAYARVVKNNIANAYRKEGDFSKAIDMYESALVMENDPKNYARLLSNQAYTKWLENPNYNATPELRRALNIRFKEKDLWGQNASYAQLADYYIKKQPDSARQLSLKMYEAAIAIRSADNQVEALQKLIPLSDAPSAKRYFERYRQLSDSLQTARNNAKNQFVVIRYETEKHKAENLELQKENAFRAFWITSLLALFTFTMVILAFWFRRRKKRMEQEAKNAIRESQLKTSKKVHDVVANGLYRIMSEMENAKQLNQEKILDSMEILYEQSRDISYEDDNEFDTDFKESIKRLLMSFATDEIKIGIVGNSGETWEYVSPEAKVELKHVLQELMVNMKKHSRANAVAVRFRNEDDQLNVWYTDNGVGCPEEVVFANGLTNTGNRIKSLGGTLSFEASTGGLSIHIQIPAAR